MHANEQLIRKFYEAFQKLDGTTMASCYHPEAKFEDPAFTLSGANIGHMWSMLCGQAQEFELEFSDIKCDDTSGEAHWEPRYLFSMTNRPVHNIIDARFEFKDGLIYRHIDHFDFWRWSRHALGLPGIILGWSSMLRNKVSSTANERLDRYIAKL